MVGKSVVYKSKKWKHKRKQILKRDGYLCQECKRFGKTTEATMVHHITPVEVSPERLWDSRNMVSLCGPCHETMHDRLTDKLTEKGREWVKRVGNNNPPHS